MEKSNYIFILDWGFPFEPGWPFLDLEIFLVGLFELEHEEGLRLVDHPDFEESFNEHGINHYLVPILLLA